MVAALSGLDALIFTAGIGENSEVASLASPKARMKESAVCALLRFVLRCLSGLGQGDHESHWLDGRSDETPLLIEALCTF